MKYKDCKVTVCSKNNENDVLLMFDKFKNQISFKDVYLSRLRHLDSGFFLDIYFTSKLSKNNIYFIVNNIQANPITFLR